MLDSPVMFDQIRNKDYLGLSLSVRKFRNTEEINCRNEQNQTPLMYACFRNDSSAVELLLENGADINCRNANWGTALQTAITGEKFDLAIMLIKREPLIGVPKRKGIIEITAIARTNRTDIAEMLLDLGADVNGVDGNGNTPFHHACQTKNVEMARFLFSKGADPRIRNKAGTTGRDWQHAHLKGISIP